MLKICISAKLFTFLVSNPLFNFVYFEYVIKIKNDFSAAVLIVLGFNDVKNYVSVFNIYIGEPSALSAFLKMDKPRKEGTSKGTGKRVVIGERVLQGYRANIND